MSTKLTNREAVLKWEEYKRNLERDIDVPHEAPEVKQARIEKLKKDPLAFAAYYFPNYHSAPLAKFHKRSIKKIVASDRIYAVRAWSREHAKSVIHGLFIPAYLMVTGKLKNMLLVSHSYDNACELLMPLMVNLEANARIINDYGKQESIRGWEMGRFITRDGCSFRALGAGQSPRGSRNEEKRPDFVLVDDLDNDEESKNQARINKKWDWVEQALFPAMSISGPKRFIVVGNIISKESCVVKASRVADDFEQVNILDSKGNPSWSERYTIEQINYMLSKISYASAQKEYFNNPINVGTVFKDLTWGKIPSYNKFNFLVAYGDSSYKATKGSDFKAVPLVGEYEGNFYVINAFVEQTNTKNMLLWFFDHRDLTPSSVQIYNYIECNGLQDAWYQDVLWPQLQALEKERGYLPMIPDDRDKPNKFARIEGNLEPLNRTKRLIFNEAQRENPHMRRLVEQFESFEPGMSGHDDGPDAVEGAIWIINNKLKVTQKIVIGKNRRSAKKY